MSVSRYSVLPQWARDLIRELEEESHFCDYVRAAAREREAELQRKLDNSTIEVNVLRERAERVECMYCGERQTHRICCACQREL